MNLSPLSEADDKAASSQAGRVHDEWCRPGRGRASQRVISASYPSRWRRTVCEEFSPPPVRNGSPSEGPAVDGAQQGTMADRGVTDTRYQNKEDDPDCMSMLDRNEPQIPEQPPPMAGVSWGPRRVPDRARPSCWGRRGRDRHRGHRPISRERGEPTAVGRFCYSNGRHDRSSRRSGEYAVISEICGRVPLGSLCHLGRPQRRPETRISVIDPCQRPFGPRDHVASCVDACRRIVLAAQ